MLPSSPRSELLFETSAARPSCNGILHSPVLHSYCRANHKVARNRRLKNQMVHMLTSEHSAAYIYGFVCTLHRNTAGTESTDEYTPSVLAHGRLTCGPPVNPMFITSASPKFLLPGAVLPKNMRDSPHRRQRACPRIDNNPNVALCVITANYLTCFVVAGSCRLDRQWSPDISDWESASRRQDDRLTNGTGNRSAMRARSRRCIGCC